MIRTFGVPLTVADFATIDRFHRTFINAGLPLKFETAGRQPRGYYPTYRELLVETDRQGHRWNFLAAEDDYQYVRSLERRDLIIPVVGDLGGPTEVAAIAKVMTERGDRLSAFYASNVEFYLWNDGTFPHFAQTTAALPRSDKSVIIRSYFGRFRMQHPQAVTGYASVQLLEPMDAFARELAAGGYKSYADMVTKNIVPNQN